MCYLCELLFVKERIIYMSNKNNNLTIQLLQPSDYSAIKNDMVRLYIDSFTKGDYAQYMDNVDVSDRLDELVCVGLIVVVLDVEKLVGFVTYTPLAADKEFPADSVADVDVRKSVYIAEVVVDAEYRGRGIATAMMEKALMDNVECYSHAVIRVWQNNRPALLLYQKLGFTPIATITQTKLIDKNESFEMKKIYLAKHLLRNNINNLCGC